MSLTQKQRAELVSERFTPTEPSEGCYVYIYLGKATYDASRYTVIDGKLLMSKRVWHVDESRTDCVSYAGRGNNRRINKPNGHPVFPSEQLRIKLRLDLSRDDSIELERQIIEELGCICDDKRPDGCLANLTYHEHGALVCPQLEAHAYQSRQAGAKAAVVIAVDVICMTEDKTVITRGNSRELGRQLSASQGCIINCCNHKKRGIWQSSEDRALYFCYANDYETYEIKPMTNRRLHAEQLVFAQKLNGSDICCGTVFEIRKYAGLRSSFNLHRVAQGKRKSAQGWTARYTDDESVDDTNIYANALKLLLHP